MEVAVEGGDEGEEEDDEREDHQQLATHVEVEHGLEVAEAQEGEELDVPLNQYFHQHPPERVDAQELTDLVVEVAVEGGDEGEEEHDKVEGHQ